MTDRKRERGAISSGWVAALVGTAALIGALAVFGAKATAAAEVRPLESRMSALEAQRAEDKEQRLRLERELSALNGKVDQVLQEVRKQ